VVICLQRGADCLHMVQLMPLHPQTPSSHASFKSRLVFTFLVPTYPGCPGKEAINRCSSSSSSSSICNMHVSEHTHKAGNGQSELVFGTGDWFV